MRRLITVGLVGLLGVSVLAACGDDDDDDGGPVQDANAAVCDDLGTYRTALADLVALDPSTATKDDYEDAVGAVADARTDLVDSAGDLAETEWENLATQIDELGDQLTDAPDDQAVASILEEAAPQAATVQASAAALNTAVCEVGGASTTDA